MPPRSGRVTRAPPAGPGRAARAMVRAVGKATARGKVRVSRVGAPVLRMDTASPRSRGRAAMTARTRSAVRARVRNGGCPVAAGAAGVPTVDLAGAAGMGGMGGRKGNAVRVPPAMISSIRAASP